MSRAKKGLKGNNNMRSSSLRISNSSNKLEFFESSIRCYNIIVRGFIK